MTIDITMPRLSDTMEKGTIIKWYVAEGDEVSAGDILADVETDKATMEMQSFDDGHMGTISVAEGMPVDVGTVVAVLLEDGEDVSAAAAVHAIPAAAEPALPATDPSPNPSPTHDGPQRKATPVARRLAEQNGVDLSALQGSGP